ncbi:hypothetical protein QL285_095850 [Trifolium repens]|nr:hypothetical protein QL285_095850 [Trifolium repens]
MSLPSLCASSLHTWIGCISSEELSLLFSPQESSFANLVGVVARCGSGGAVKCSGECGGAGGGLLSLRDDVEMCGYKDVEIMWNMLSLSITPETMETPRSNIKKKLPRRSGKQRFNSRIFFWTNHNP